jgi:hypothetical protein
MKDTPISTEKARPLLIALEASGEKDLARTIADYLEARARGESADRCADIWLD